MMRAAEMKFDFSSDQVKAGYTRVTAETGYDAQLGHGFLNNAGLAKGATTTFEVNVPEGNYNVTMVFGAPSSATSTIVKAESRRLMLPKVETTPGKYETRTFTVNVRTPAIAGTGRPWP